ncbi:hypothetical protein [Paracidovorax oryzae]|uniref:hypothetical protein n=1 Tax=Paracidovorax oryzae TaxID=862720 RepID=UPI0035D01BBC
MRQTLAEAMRRQDEEEAAARLQRMLDTGTLDDADIEAVLAPLRGPAHSAPLPLRETPRTLETVPEGSEALDASTHRGSTSTDSFHDAQSRFSFGDQAVGSDALQAAAAHAFQRSPMLQRWLDEKS